MSHEHQFTRRFQLGLVVGKFAPLHLGHEWMIAQAERACDRVLILSYTNPEFMHCDVRTRRRWLTERFPRHESHVIDAVWLHQTCYQRGIECQPLPLNEANDAIHQHFLAWLLRDVLQRTPDAMFSSEAYGPSCAALLSMVFGNSVEAVVVDCARQNIPISATQIRQDPSVHWNWMAAEVRATFIPRIVFLGAESTGKTTLAAALASHFATTYVAEYGRELWECQQGILSEPDLLRIAHEQVRREEFELRSANAFLFCDTSPLTTMGYSRWMFNRIDPELAALANRPYAGVVFCQPDFPLVQDGTRRDEAFRLMQHAWFHEQLADYSCPVLEVSGSVSARIATVVEWLCGSAWSSEWMKTESDNQASARQI